MGPFLPFFFLVLVALGFVTEDWFLIGTKTKIQLKPGNCKDKKNYHLNCLKLYITSTFFRSRYTDHFRLNYVMTTAETYPNKSYHVEIVETWWFLVKMGIILPISTRKYLFSKRSVVLDLQFRHITTLTDDSDDTHQVIQLMSSCRSCIKEQEIQGQGTRSQEPRTHRITRQFSFKMLWNKSITNQESIT